MAKKFSFGPWRKKQIKLRSLWTYGGFVSRICRYWYGAGATGGVNGFRSQTGGWLVQKCWGVPYGTYAIVTG